MVATLEHVLLPVMIVVGERAMQQHRPLNGIPTASTARLLICHKRKDAAGNAADPLTIRPTRY
jgi:hypothetical protein